MVQDAFITNQLFNINFSKCCSYKIISKSAQKDVMPESLESFTLFNVCSKRVARALHVATLSSYTTLISVWKKGLARRTSHNKCCMADYRVTGKSDRFCRDYSQWDNSIKVGVLWNALEN